MSIKNFETSILQLIHSVFPLEKTTTQWDSETIETLIEKSPPELLQRVQIRGHTLLASYLISASEHHLSTKSFEILFHKTFVSLSSSNRCVGQRTNTNYVAAYLRRLRPLTTSQIDTLLEYSELGALLSCDTDTLFSYALTMCSIEQVELYTIFSDTQIEYILNHTDLEAKNDFNMRTVDVYLEVVKPHTRLKPEHEDILFSKTRWCLKSFYHSFYWLIKKDTTAAQLFFDYFQSKAPTLYQSFIPIQSKSHVRAFQYIFSLLRKIPHKALFEFLIFDKKIDICMLERFLLKHPAQEFENAAIQEAHALLLFYIQVSKEKSQFSTELEKIMLPIFKPHSGLQQSGRQKI